VLRDVILFFYTVAVTASVICAAQADRRSSASFFRVKIFFGLMVAPPILYAVGWLLDRLIRLFS